MVERLWVQGLGVSPEAVARYAGRGRGREPERHLRKEAWLRGVAYPTGCIPPGHVFVSSMAAERCPPMVGAR